MSTKIAKPSATTEKILGSLDKKSGKIKKKKNRKGNKQKGLKLPKDTTSKMPEKSDLELAKSNLPRTEKSFIFFSLKN